MDTEVLEKETTLENLDLYSYNTSKEEHVVRYGEFYKAMLSDKRYEMDNEVESYDEYAGAIHFKNGSFYVFSDHTFNSGKFATRVLNVDIKVETLNMAMRLARMNQI